MDDQSSYYVEKLSAERLKRCYEIAPPRVQQYLAAEVEHVLQRIRSTDTVLELGCGYGRILPALAQGARSVIGIDNSQASLFLAEMVVTGISNCYVMCMDAVHLAFGNDEFDVVVCIQNGISAFHVDQKALIAEAMRVTRPGGTVMFSTYSERFWEDRLEWFRLQSEAGLLDEIDYEKTGNGVIVCKDGFTAITVGREDFTALTADLEADIQITEVDNSSLFCEITLR